MTDERPAALTPEQCNAILDDASDTLRHAPLAEELARRLARHAVLLVESLATRAGATSLVYSSVVAWGGLALRARVMQTAPWWDPKGMEGRDD